MRADRLLRLIRVLSDGRPRTIPALAALLEVSERTVARDLLALEVAGAPVGTARGRHGGVSLPRGWARLGVGLTSAEVVPIAALGAPDAFRTSLSTALGKIVAGLPAAQRQEAEEVRQRLLVDPTPWWSEPEPAPLVDRLREAVWGDRRVRLAYASADGRRSEREVEPWALVLKADRWYLVAGTGEGTRIFRCDRVVSVSVLDAGFARPADFDLPATWRAWGAAFEASRPSLPVRLVLTTNGRARLAALRPPSERAAILGDEQPVVDFQRVEIALGQLAQVGAEARVLSPPEVVEAMRALARAWSEGTGA